MTKTWPIIAVLMLSGCANLNLHPDTGNTTAPKTKQEDTVIPPQANQHLNEIADINRFKLSGRIGIQIV